MRRSNGQLAAISTLGVLLGLAWAGPIFSGTKTAPTNAALRPRPPSGRDLLDQLETAQVSRGERHCDHFSGFRWDCGLKPWLFVGRYFGKATTSRGPEYRSCLWLHPEGSSKPLTIRFPSVSLGRTLQGEATLLDVPKPGGAVTVKIQIADGPKTTLRLQDANNKRAWKRWRLQTTPGTTAVSIVVTAAKADWRHVCLTAFVIDDPS